MARTKQLRESDYPKRFTIPDRTYAGIPYFSDEKVLEILEKWKEGQAAVNTNIFSRSFHQGDKLGELILEENIRIFVNNSQPDKATSEEFEKYLRYNSSVYGRKEYIDADIFALYNINEFLNHDSYKESTYGDYLDEHWDENYENTLKLNFNVYPNTKDLIGKLAHSKMLSHHKALSNSEKKFIENLTFEEIKYLTDLPAGSLNGDIDKSSKQLKLLLSYMGSTNRIPNRLEIKTLILNAFMKKISNIPMPHKYDVPSLYTYVGELLKETNISASPKEINSNSLYSGDIEPVLKFIFENIDDFSIQNVVGIIISLSSKPTFSRSGTFAEYAKFLKTVISENKKEDAIYTLEVIANVIVRSDNQRPTMNEWRKAYNSGLLDGSLPYDLFIALATTEKEFKPSGILTRGRHLLY